MNKATAKWELKRIEQNLLHEIQTQDIKHSQNYLKLDDIF